MMILKIPPLRDVNFNSRPLVKRAVAWSGDGELAVAADDSVHVLVPSFPGSGIVVGVSGDARANSSNDDDMDTGHGVDDEDADMRPAFLRRRKQAHSRPQFSEGSLQIPVSYPRLSLQVNTELFEVAGLPSPDASEVPHNGTDAADPDEVEGESGSESSVLDSRDTVSKVVDVAEGVGSGLISGSNSSFNHVVRISWSPAGLGHGGRPVLAVLTSAGTIGIYGDRPSSEEASSFAPLRGKDGMVKQRSLSSWAILWGVGGRLTVPHQKSKAEYIQGMAWSREITAGHALLAYINDSNEVVVLDVRYQRVSTATNEYSKQKKIHKGPSQENASATTVEEKMWKVYELSRFKSECPHVGKFVWDPDYTPCGTSFGLTWSPWLLTGESRICVLSYIDRDFVGFRKVVVENVNTPNNTPTISVGQTDLSSLCAALTTDSFVEFEDAIWTRDQSKLVRGLLSTGFDVIPFEVIIAGDVLPRTEHREQCDASSMARPTYGTNGQLANPIQDLIIHPPDLINPTPTPMYSLVRLSATSNNQDWYQTNMNVFNGQQGESRKPAWVLDISQKLEISVPTDLKGLGAFENMDETGDMPTADEPAAGGNSERVEVSDDASDNGFPQTTEIHPYRFRLLGLAASPGGGASVVLVSRLSTQQPHRENWSDLRSTLLFDSKPRERPSKRDGSKLRSLLYGRLTTEGRMLEWMYGAGPDVPGVTTMYDDARNPIENLAEAAERRSLRDLFSDAVAQQQCEMCQQPMEVKGTDGRHSICKLGHFFSTCGSSGLAIQAPGISRTCGVCGSRTLKLPYLIQKAPHMAGKIKEIFNEDRCGNCGGKFVD
ncbi:hypothetical protein VTK73DRAFT_2034 [Phialemonium thermophilum]|uniref:Transcription factor IIIC putative zinc-finger domain-containing protein n=1 Tax=Phialemonium thermophilum TaxID=223376 RepID=A0ABR3X6L6_9PEZI